MSNVLRRALSPRNRSPFAVILVGIMLCGCSTDFASTLFETGKTSEATADAQPNAALSAADESAAKAQLVITESRKLKAAGKTKDALALLEKSSQGKDADRSILVERGYTHLELGQAEAARKVLAQIDAADKDKKDWRVLSGIGVALATQNRPKEAQKYFTKALELSPGNPTILNNMAIAHMLDRKPNEAESVLRTAMSGKGFPPQVTRNLALAQALQVDPVRDKPEANAF
jgi:Flp pilus assembly protein TadD